MTKFSVPGYNIRDRDGNILYDGDIVKMLWGGGNDGRPYRIFQYHRLTIGRFGKLRISGCENIVKPKELVKIDPAVSYYYQIYGTNNQWKDYN